MRKKSVVDTVCETVSGCFGHKMTKARKRVKRAKRKVSRRAYKRTRY